ncbi:Plasmodium vivax Vir protein/Plasmodium variant antigen protein Cir/Yir/Bir, putative [Plasmodium vivax]|uniref:Vir protein/Plasmodium variant antigen protein Cir/Yir/Bir, putative n=1 Tax=Plasmodium vivax TaxID=5855 RepID=A0A1G4HDM4_PLAVI|nr:Plasmodium vivax Vir protein/Plasmodium variant antigen protein Cir/Yir/Bir, putative [Plasmodium vivax]
MGESYDFCNYLDLYITTESSLPSGSYNTANTYNCMFIFHGNVRKDTLRSLCSRFINLYDLIFFPFVSYASKNNENVEYMNYWLNKELKNNGTSNISATEFYQELISNNSLFDTDKRLKNKIHKINADDLEKMNTLYHLNGIFHNIKMTSYYDETKCKSHSTECFQKFTDAIKKCSTDKKDKYCKALKSFKKKYEDYNGDNNLGGCKHEYLLKLPQLGEENENSAIVTASDLGKSESQQLTEKKNEQHFPAQDDLGEKQASTYPIQTSFSQTGENHNDNNISIFTIFGIILSISVFSTITYKFTPFGSWINRRLKRNKINWRNVEDEKEPKRLLEYNDDPKQLILRDVPYSVPYNSL